MSKKKILIVAPSMCTGGISQSLKNLLINITNHFSDYELDLFLLKKYGVNLEGIPEKINIREAKGNLQLFGCSQSDSKQFGKWFYFKRAVVALWSRIFSSALPVEFFRKKEKFNKHYDFAISFTCSSRTMGAGGAELVLKNVSADKKAVFIHGDIEKNNIATKRNLKQFKQFDKIFCVSESLKNQLVKNLPELDKNADFVYNTQDNESIKEKSNAFKVELGKDFNIVSVSRLSFDKAIDRFLQVVKKLHEEGYKFTYHIVGDGAEKYKIEKIISQHNMADYVKMYGNQKNPYPYFKSADLFVLPSESEAAPMVINESFLIGTPLLTTNTISAKEMVKRGGWVVDNSEEGLYEGLKYILNNHEELKEKAEELKNFNYDNVKIVQELLEKIN